jgi:hypothetical protein
MTSRRSYSTGSQSMPPGPHSTLPNARALGRQHGYAYGSRRFAPRADGDGSREGRTGDQRVRRGGAQLGQVTRRSWSKQCAMNGCAWSGTMPPTQRSSTSCGRSRDCHGLVSRTCFASRTGSAVQRILRRSALCPTQPTGSSPRSPTPPSIPLWGVTCTSTRMPQSGWGCRVTSTLCTPLARTFFDPQIRLASGKATAA